MVMKSKQRDKVKRLEDNWVSLTSPEKILICSSEGFSGILEPSLHLDRVINCAGKQTHTACLSAHEIDVLPYNKNDYKSLKSWRAVIKTLGYNFLRILPSDTESF